MIRPVEFHLEIRGSWMSTWSPTERTDKLWLCLSAHVTLFSYWVSFLLDACSNCWSDTLWYTKGWDGKEVLYGRLKSRDKLAIILRRWENSKTHVTSNETHRKMRFSKLRISFVLRPIPRDHLTSDCKGLIVRVWSCEGDRICEIRSGIGARCPSE